MAVRAEVMLYAFNSLFCPYGQTAEELLRAPSVPQAMYYVSDNVGSFCIPAVLFSKSTNTLKSRKATIFNSNFLDLKLWSVADSRNCQIDALAFFLWNVTFSWHQSYGYERSSVLGTFCQTAWDRDASWPRKSQNSGHLILHNWHAMLCSEIEIHKCFHQWKVLKLKKLQKFMAVREKEISKWQQAVTEWCCMARFTVVWSETVLKNTDRFAGWHFLVIYVTQWGHHCSVSKASDPVTEYEQSPPPHNVSLCENIVYSTTATPTTDNIC